MAWWCHVNQFFFFFWPRSDNFRKHDVVRIINSEVGSVMDVSFVPRCGWAVIVANHYNETNLRKIAGFDVEQERFQFLRQYSQL